MVGWSLKLCKSVCLCRCFVYFKFEELTTVDAEPSLKLAAFLEQLRVLSSNETPPQTSFRFTLLMILASHSRYKIPTEIFSCMRQTHVSCSLEGAILISLLDNHVESHGWFAKLSIENFFPSWKFSATTKPLKVSWGLILESNKAEDFIFPVSGFPPQDGVKENKRQFKRIKASPGAGSLEILLHHAWAAGNPISSSDKSQWVCLFFFCLVTPMMILVDAKST